MGTELLITISEFLLIILLFPLGYLMLLALGSIRSGYRGEREDRSPSTRFMIAIPAHNEGNVIRNTVKRLRVLNYPGNLFSIHIVADHCSDNTAELARQAGANVHERFDGPRTGKGAALSWLFDKALDQEGFDAVVIFDADTLVDPEFLQVMDGRLAQGDQVIQGQHIISNPDQGWFPALAWAMFLIDNRFQNLGRSNHGWSAKNMGDSICFRVDVLRSLGWGEGLTEDYHLRQKLLLNGIRIVYEPAAKGYGEAPPTWESARVQRARWLRGTRDSSQHYAKRLFSEGIRKRSLAMIEGAVQARFPSYSTLSMLTLLILILHIPMFLFIEPAALWPLIFAWAVELGALMIYPLVGLALERAPTKAYFAIMMGPYFIFWRTWLAFISRLGAKQGIWIRTEHGKVE